MTEYRGRQVEAMKISETIVQEIRITVPFPFDLELMQVRVGPAHCGLDVFVQLIECAILNLNPPPDRWFESEQRNLELIEKIRVRLQPGLQLYILQLSSPRHDSLFKLIHQVAGNQ